MGVACSQPTPTQTPAQNKALTAKPGGDGRTGGTIAGSVAVNSSIDNTLNNMAKQEERKQGGGDPNAPPGSDAAPMTNDEHERIERLLNSARCKALTPPVVKIVRETWAAAMKRSDFAVAFYNDLLTKHRSMTEAIFYGVDIVLQAGRLVKMIEGAINLLETPKSLVPVIIRLGSRHVAYGTTSQHFVLVADSLTHLIKETVGTAKITPEVEGHWRTVLGFFQEIMESGYSTTAGKGVGKKHHARIQRTLLKCWKSATSGHTKQLRQAGGAAPLPTMEMITNAASAQKPVTSPTTSNPNGGGPPLIFGLPATLVEAMISSGMQQFIANSRHGNPSNPTSPNTESPAAAAGHCAINYDADNNYLTNAINHLLVPPMSTTALEAFTKLPPNEFDALIVDAFEIGLNNIDDNLQYFDGKAPPAGTEAPKTLHDSELLFQRLRATGTLLVSLGAHRGDPEAFNDAFVKSTLQFASPEWNNPFVRDQLARFWMKFCSYMAVGIPRK